MRREYQRRRCGTYAAGSGPARSGCCSTPTRCRQPTRERPEADRYRRWHTVAFDGCASLRCPDSERNQATLGRSETGRGGFHGLPCQQLVTLAETGTRDLLGAVFGPSATGEITCAAQLVNVRVVQAQITALLSDGTRITGTHKPAIELIGLYHERREIESGYIALRRTLLHGRVLRSMEPSGIEQKRLTAFLHQSEWDHARSSPNAVGPHTSGAA